MSAGSDLWAASESAVFVYFQGRYLPATYFVARAVSYPLLNAEQSKRAFKAFSDWLRFVEQLRKTSGAIHRQLVQRTADNLGAVFLEELGHRAAFAVGRAARAYSVASSRKQRRNARTAALLSFGLSLAVQHLIGWPRDYLLASARASAALAREIGEAAAQDTLLLRRLSALAIDLAATLKVLQPHTGR
jgi:hypothetical protein